MGARCYRKEKDTTTAVPIALEEDECIDYVIAVIGSKGCGKSCFLTSAITRQWDPAPLERSEFVFILNPTTSTLASKSMVPGTVWKQNPKKSFLSLQPSEGRLKTDQGFVRTLRVLALTFAVDNIDSFEDVKEFKLFLFKTYTDFPSLPKLVIGLKCDAERVVSSELMQEWIDELNAQLKEEYGQVDEKVEWIGLEISAKEGNGIDEFVKEVREAIVW